MVYGNKGFSIFETKHMRNVMRAEMSNWIYEYDYDFFVTLNFNRSVTANGAREKLKNFLGRIDRRFIGRNWVKRPGKRTEMIVFPENTRSNYHFHAGAKFPPKASQFGEVGIGVEVKKAWRSIVPSGDTDVQLISRTPRRVANYMTKQMTRYDGPEGFFLSREFWSTDPVDED